MRKSVDVLAVMERAAGGLFQFSKEWSAEIMEARAAVAELIGAARSMHGMVDSCGCYAATNENLADALIRAQGGTP